MNAIPVTILTGFLGSGKTTALNHILASEHGLKIGVIVNEFGSISIDDKLITDNAQNIIELANGCICCSMQGDLLKALHQVSESSANIDYILLETSGLADPLPIASRLWDRDLGDAFRLDGIITIVDSLNFDANLDCAEVAFSQLVGGDLILLNKIDLVEDHIPDLIREGIRKINRSARILTCVNANIDPYLLVDVSLSRLQGLESETEKSVPGSASLHHRHEQSEFENVSFESAQSIDPELFKAFINTIPANVYRGKGVLNIDDEESRCIFHLVGGRCAVTSGRPWLENEERKSQLVFIGRHLNKVGLLDQLTGCLI